MIIVCSLREAQNQIERHGARQAVSILGPDMPHHDFAGLDKGRHLKLTFHDVAMIIDGLNAPQAQHVETLLRFLRDWDQSSPLLIHCWAGISRSTAAAYIALCLFKPEADERELAWTLRAASPSATPNSRMVAMADQILARGGRMTSAIAAIGRGEDAFEGQPFVLPLT